MIGVLRSSSSCLIASSRAEAGLLGKADGRMADRGVLSAGWSVVEETGDFGISIVGT